MSTQPSGSSLQLKYQSVIDLARMHVADLQVSESNNVLYLNGTAATESAKQQIWDAYNTIDPDMRSGDVVLNLSVEGVVAGAASTYEVQSGDNLSKIAKGYGLTWQEVFNANRDKLDNPDKIFPGQVLNIPAK